MTDSLAVEIIEAVAEERGTDPLDLEFELAEYVDVDALALLEAHDGSPWSLSFDLPEHTVTVTSAGGILVDESRDKVVSSP